MPEYDPDLLAAIHQAREDLYYAQAAKRRAYLLTGKYPPPVSTAADPPARPGARLLSAPPADAVQAARAELDAARAMARVTGAG